MDIKKFVSENADLTELARAHETGLGRALLAASARKEAQIVNEVVVNPIKSDKIAESVEYKLGMIAGLRWHKELTQAAGKYLGRVNEGEKR